MAKYENFELNEFIESAKAKEKKIDNTPTFDVVDHLNELISSILQPLRTAWGSGITISSGFRCKALNSAIAGSSDTSVHQLGYAADMMPNNGDFKGFVDFTKKYLQEHSIAFDQLIIESNSAGEKWLHIGLKNNAGLQRRQIKTMSV